MLIRLHAINPWNVSLEEYEQLQNEVMARSLGQDITLGDKILARLLLDNASRYHELRALREYAKQQSMTP